MMQASPIQITIRNAIKQEFELGYTPKIVWEHVQEAGTYVSRRTIHLYYNRWLESGQILRGVISKTGRPPILTGAIIQVISRLDSKIY